MGFKLSIRNPSPEAVWWSAMYHNGAYSPSGSGLIALNESWNNPNPASGETDLLIWTMRADYSIIQTRMQLGPVNDGYTYVFDFATSTLSATKESSPWLWLGAGAGVVAVLLALASAGKGIKTR